MVLRQCDVSNLFSNWIRFHGKYMRPRARASHFPNNVNVHSMIIVIEPITSIMIFFQITELFNDIETTWKI